MLSRRPVPPRVPLVQRELDRFARPRYLEIGIYTGTLFLNVVAHRKVGVDPFPRIRRRQWLKRPLGWRRSTVVRSTSDDYLASLDPDARFDVVFIDGYHSYQQALRDIEGSVQHLADGGVVMVHDCYPPTADAAEPDPSKAGPGSDDGWCGDVWKAITHLRATRPDLATQVLDIDFGIGVVRRGRSQTLDITVDAIRALSYEDLRRDPVRLIGLRPISADR